MQFTKYGLELAIHFLAQLFELIVQMIDLPLQPCLAFRKESDIRIDVLEHYADPAELVFIFPFS